MFLERRASLWSALACSRFRSFVRWSFHSSIHSFILKIANPRTNPFILKSKNSDSPTRLWCYQQQHQQQQRQLRNHLHAFISDTKFTSERSIASKSNRFVCCMKSRNSFRGSLLLGVFSPSLAPPPPPVRLKIDSKFSISCSRRQHGRTQPLETFSSA